MMDCSKTEVFFKEWRRMCDEAEELHTCLLLQKGITVGCVNCEENVRKNADEAIKIIQEWSDANPIKTRLSVLKEQYPNLKTYDGRVVFCAGELYVFSCGKRTSCDDCWNEPIEDGEGNG